MDHQFISIPLKIQKSLKVWANLHGSKLICHHTSGSPEIWDGGKIMA
jgi:hypothetical protein